MYSVYQIPVQSFNRKNTDRVWIWKRANFTGNDKRTANDSMIDFKPLKVVIVWIWNNLPPTANSLCDLSNSLQGGILQHLICWCCIFYLVKWMNVVLWSVIFGWMSQMTRTHTFIGCIPVCKSSKRPVKLFATHWKIPALSIPGLSPCQRWLTETNMSCQCCEIVHTSGPTWARSPLPLILILGTLIINT